MPLKNPVSAEGKKGKCSSSSQIALAMIRFQPEKLGQLVQCEVGGRGAELLGTESSQDHQTTPVPLPGVTRHGGAGDTSY